MARSAKILSAVAVILAIAALYVLNPSLPVPESGQSALLYQPGPFQIARESLELTDNTRPTNPNGNYAGSPVRELNGFVWYPKTSQPQSFPLIIYSHGFMSSVSEPEYLVDFLVPRGYILVAVNYPLSHGGAPGGPNVNDVVNQPADVSFVIDSLLARNADSSDSLYGLLDPERIAAVGLSLGGLTTQLVAYHRDLRDPRLRAAVSIAGPSNFLEARFFETSDIPFMMIAGSADAAIPYESNAAPIPSKAVNSVLVTLDKGSHVGFAGMSATFSRWFRHPDQLICPLLLSNLDLENSQPRPILAVDPELGISNPEEVPCMMSTFERAMRPADQQMLTRLALLAFLEKEFSFDAGTREQMEQYIARGFAAENPAALVNRNSQSNI
jgi:predicted dienelactone hydrolase